MPATAIAIILLFLTLTPCSDPPRPPNQPPAVNASEIVDEHVFNESRASQRYLHQWFTVTAGPIVRISGNRRAVSRYRGYAVHLLFQDKAEAQSIDRNDHVTALCWLRHQTQGLIVFDSCEFAANPRPR